MASIAGANATPQGALNRSSATDKLKKFFQEAETSESAIKRKQEGGSLRYPVDESFPVYMQYRVREIIPPVMNALDQSNELYQAYAADDIPPVKDAGMGGGNAETAAEQARKAKIESEYSKFRSIEAAAGQEYQQRVALSKRKGLQQGLLGFKTAYLENPIDVRLYMPPGIMVHDNIQYDQQGMGLAAASGLMAFNNTGSGLAALKGVASEMATSLSGLFGGGGGDLETARIGGARLAGLAQKALTSGQQAAIGLALQVKVNPNTRSIFQGVSVRNFSFQYDFFPTSRQEQNIVEKIVRMFRVQMYPAAIPESSLIEGFPLGYKFPNLFEITFKHGNTTIEGMPKPLFCYLRDCSTSYNPGNTGFHDQGKPTHINMSLQFQEFRALNQQDIQDGH
tara:strand:- start:358 stop:1542 length:1185 start_codon:yes stop_codon:yes gene_type:complete